MKAFEEWFKQNENDIWASEAVEEKLAEMAWKAALEWIEEMFQLNVLHDAGINVREELKKELKE